MEQDRRAPPFERYVKMKGSWHRLSRPQKIWVKAISTGERRVEFVGSGGSRYGWGSVHRMWREYQQKIKVYEKGMRMHYEEKVGQTRSM